MKLVYKIQEGNACYHSVQDILLFPLLCNMNIKNKEDWFSLQFYTDVKLYRTKCDRRLGVFENRVLRIVLGPKRDDTMGVRRRIYDATPNINSYFSQIR
jgi:hypothetical protein